MTHVYTRERHENKNTRFWATYAVRKFVRVTCESCFSFVSLATTVAL